MANYKNQNIITDISVEKIRHIKDTGVAWMQPFDWDKMKIMLYLLSGNEYKFYMYLFSWAGKKQYEFSPADLTKQLGFKEDTARKIFKRFVELGLLVQIKEHRFIFDAYPEKAIQEYNNKWMQENASEVV